MFENYEESSWKETYARNRWGDRKKMDKRSQLEIHTNYIAK